ncbi:MAG: DUF4169 family protein [Caulobacteraceae bacterium]|nr:DUF4169 family protein [Caulobacteraceae bacterium]
MAELINLNKARKARAKAETAATAAANRARFGRTKAEKLADKAEAERKARTLDQARRERDDADPV